MKSDKLLFKGCQSHTKLGKKLKSVKVNNDSVQQRKTENEKKIVEPRAGNKEG